MTYSADGLPEIGCYETRGGLVGSVKRYSNASDGPDGETFVLRGRIIGVVENACWRADGMYNADGEPHEYDLMLLKPLGNLKAKAKVAQDIDATLTERGSRYGKFTGHARVTQNIKAAMRDSKNWELLPPDMAECLEMLAHKIGRILNGDFNYHDSWHDMSGYAKLVADRIQGEEK